MDLIIVTLPKEYAVRPLFPVKCTSQFLILILSSQVPPSEKDAIKIEQPAHMIKKRLSDDSDDARP